MSKLSSLLGDSFSGGNSLSPIARLGQFGQKYTDPLAWAFGDKYTNALAKTADKSNAFFSKLAKPAAWADKRINPLRRIGAYDNLASWTEKKPLDTAAIAAGIYFGGPALYNASGLGAADSAAGSGPIAADSAGGGLLADTAAGAAADTPLITAEQVAAAGPTIEPVAAPVINYSSGLGDAGQYLKAGNGLLQQGQPQQQQPAMQAQPVDVQKQQRARLQLLQENQLQQLRMRPNKTMEDYMQLAQMNHNQGLLGQ